MSRKTLPYTRIAEMVESLRDNYRRDHLEAIAPDAAGGRTPEGDWTQLIGASYDRRIDSFEIETTDEQDRRIVEKLNSSQNRTHFNLFLFNCADFSKAVINAYYPRATHRSLFADQGITTPKQIAKSLVSYSRRHPDLRFSCFTIEQVPGTLPRSEHVRNVFEAFLKKKYVLPIAVFHPLVAGGMLVAYVAMACFDPHRNFERHMEGEAQPAAILAGLRANTSIGPAAAGGE